MPHSKTLNRSAVPFHRHHPLKRALFVFQCITLSPSWGKGYARKGAALHGAHRYSDAVAAYEQGIQYEDSPALRKGLQEVKDAQGPRTAPALVMLNADNCTAKDASAGPELGLGRLFSDPNLIGKLATNPRTQKHLADPSFVQMVRSPVKTFREPFLIHHH